jgi:carbon monoxide dehydrogenase subunit G
MRLEGSYTIRADREKVWEKLLNPEVLARVMPGCEKLVPNRDGSYSASMKMGFSMSKGTYQGRIEILDQVQPERFRMKVDGKGSAGFVRGEGTLTFAQNSGDTIISYGGDIQVGGLIASVGQRLILGAAKQSLNKFFEDFTKQLSAPPPQPATAEILPMPPKP